MTKPFLGICAIVKNEGPYIHEWLTYHRALGVERFTIYHNGSADNTLAEIARFGHPVDLIDWPGEAPQVRAYRDMLANRRHYAEWVAFIDVDEFLMQRGATLRDMLAQQSQHVGVLYVQWVFFGSSGQTERRPGGVTQRFTRRSHLTFAPNRYGKSIVRMDLAADLITPHKIGTRGVMVDTRGEIIDQRAEMPPVACHDGIALAHYFTKSEGEWRTRRALGRPALPANHPDAIRGMDQFAAHDRNEVEDRTVADVLPSVISHWAELPL